MLVADLEVRIIDEDGTILRRFVLDPTKDYQPLRATTTLRGFKRPRNSETSHGWR